MSHATKKLIDICESSDDDCEKVKRIKNIQEETLSTAIADCRFYSVIRQYVDVIQAVGIKFNFMLHSYIRAMMMMTTNVEETPKYLDVVKHASALMNQACDVMKSSLHVSKRDAANLTSICLESQDTISLLHEELLELCP